MRINCSVRHGCSCAYAGLYLHLSGACHFREHFIHPYLQDALLLTGGCDAHYSCITAAAACGTRWGAPHQSYDDAPSGVRNRTARTHADRLLSSGKAPARLGSRILFSVYVQISVGRPLRRDVVGKCWKRVEESIWNTPTCACHNFMSKAGFFEHENGTVQGSALLVDGARRQFQALLWK